MYFMVVFCSNIGCVVSP